LSCFGEVGNTFDEFSHGFSWLKVGVGHKFYWGDSKPRLKFSHYFEKLLKSL
jgi:hypothetical protein